MIEPLPVCLLLACVLYAFIYGVKDRSPLPIFAAAIILNQTILSIYFLVPGAPVLHEWPLAQAMICIAFGLAAWWLSRYAYLAESASAIYSYSSVTLLATFGYIALWRLAVACDWVNFPAAYPVYARAAVIIAALLFAFYTRLRWRWQPYAALAAVLIAVVFALDIAMAAAIFYPLATIAVALVYALLPLAFPTLASFFDHAAIFLATILAYCFVHYYLYPPTASERYWAALIGGLLTLHAVYYFCRSQWRGWAYLSAIYLYATVYIDIARPLALPWMIHGLILGGLTLAIVIGLQWLRRYQFGAEYRRIAFAFSGETLTHAWHDVGAVVSALFLAVVFGLWLASALAAIGIHINISWQPAMATAQQRPLLWAGILLLYLAIWAILEKCKHSASLIRAADGLIATAALLLLWFPYLTRYLDRSSFGFTFSSLELAGYGLGLMLIYYRRPHCRHLFNWSLGLAGVPLLVACYHYQLLSSVLVLSLLTLTATLAMVRHYQSQEMWRGLHIPLLMITLAMTGHYAFIMPAPLWPGDLTTMALLVGAYLTLWWQRRAARLVQKDNSRLAFELARIAVLLALVIAGIQGYRYGCPPLAYQSVAALTAIVAAMPLLLWIGKHEDWPVCYYLLQLLGPLTYLFLRFRLGLLTPLAGHDLPAVFALFVFAPNLLAIWLNDAKMRTVIKQFFARSGAGDLGAGKSLRIMPGALGVVSGIYRFIIQLTRYVIAGG